MFKNKKRVLNLTILGLLLLGGCALLENCEGYYELIGNLTIVAATQTHIASFASKFAMDNVAGHSYTASDENWYLNTNIGYLYVRVTKAGGPVDPGPLTDLSGVTKFEVKIDTVDATGNDVNLEMAWTTVTSTPTADGTLTYSAGDGNSLSASFDGISYDTSGWVNAGGSDITFTPNVPLFGSFKVVLVHSADNSAIGTVTSDPSGSALGEVRIVANKDAASGEPLYEIDYIKNAAGETKVSGASSN